MNPIKFYFFCSFVFLFCLFHVPGLEILISKTGVSVLTVSRSEFILKSQLGVPSLDSAFSTLTDRQEVIGNAGFLLLLIIPLSSSFLKIFFSRVPLVQHLVFSFHFHGLALLVLLPGFIPLSNSTLHDLFNDLLTLLALVYLGAMLKHVYQLSLKKTLFLLPVFFGFYVLSFIGIALMKVF